MLIAILIILASLVSFIIGNELADLRAAAEHTRLQAQLDNERYQTTALTLTEATRSRAIQLIAQGYHIDGIIMTRPDSTPARSTQPDLHALIFHDALRRITPVEMWSIMSGKVEYRLIDPPATTAATLRVLTTLEA